MKKIKFIFLFIVFLIPKWIFSQDLVSHLKFFSSFQSRMPGSKGHQQSVDYIERIFKEAGLKNVTKEEFFSVVPVEKGSFIEFKNKRIPIFCLWPNLVRSSSLPSEGISGKLIYGKDGNLENLEGKDIKDNIIVLDFGCGSNWLNLAMLGARGFIFLEGENITRNEAERKFLDVPLNVPRFYAKKENVREILELAKEESTIKLYGKMEWQKVPDYNIYGYIEGTDKKLKEEVIILESYYDSISVVPEIAPGAENACSISTLLEILDFFKNNPPKRTILFLACSGHYENLKGITNFVNNHLRITKPFSTRIKEKGIIEPFKLGLKKPDDVVPKKILFIGLDISSHSDEIGIWHNSYEFYHQKFFAPFAKTFLSYSESICKQFGFNTETSLINGISPEKGIIWQSLLPDLIRTDGEIVVLAGIPGISFVTVNDGRWKIDTPVDTFEKLDISNLEKQTLFLKYLLKKAIDEPDFLADTELKLPDRMSCLTAKIVSFNPKKDFVPKDPIKNALVIPRIYELGSIYLPYEKNYTGVRGNLIEMTDENGIAKFPGLRMDIPVWLNAFSLDTETGEINYATDMGINGNEQYPITFRIDLREKEWVIVLFKCKPINLFSLIDPQYLVQLSAINVFDLSNSIPDAYGYCLQYPAYIPWSWKSYSEPYGVVFSKPGMKIKITGEAGPLGIRLLLLNSKESFENKEFVEGLGFLSDEISAIYETPYQSSKDMIFLDKFRTYNFEKFGIKNDRLKELQKESYLLLKRAEREKGKKSWRYFLKFSRQAQALESRAYPDVKSTTNDVVKGIIFYFILLLPFAYFGERLLFGFPKIEHRIIGTFGIFLTIYWIMRIVHPAFKLTNAPEVILLSFIVLALSFIVLSIVAGKFEEQMQKMKRESSKVYQTDVGRITATGTAFSLGVANMKRRKMRTVLTSITLILLTFTVLSFTSIKAYMKFNKISRTNKPIYEGILLRDRTWAPLQEISLEYTKDEFSDVGIISPRAWFILKVLGNRSAIEIKYGNKTFLATGILGVSPQEKEITWIDKSLISGKWFNPEEKNICFISEKIAKALGIGNEQVGYAYIKIYGKELLVKGIFDPDSLNKVKDIDDEKITPVDFSSLPEKEISKIKMEKTAQVYSSQIKIQSFIHADSENIVICPYETVMDMGGTLQSIAVKFKGTENAQLIKSFVESFISKLAVILFAGIEGKTYIYSSMGLTSFSGISNLIIPILIAAMIVLNTMLGSVYERIKEISTYSAVGLAPVHIASLFLAESLVYAVLGAVAGYLLGQVISKILLITGTLKGLVLNYSSLSAVFSTLIIVLTVVLSTLYPARKASQMAVPDVTRKWVLPEPKGDNWEFEFPFTVSEFEVLGLVTFLTEYFNSYQDVSIGNFYTNGANLKCEKLPIGKNKYTIETGVWIAPFDLGVNQKLKVEMEPLGQYNFYTINLSIIRVGGEVNDWKRLNKRFLDGIRKQFLIWRTVSPSIKKDYENQGKEMLKLTNSK